MMGDQPSESWNDVGSNANDTNTDVVSEREFHRRLEQAKFDALAEFAAGAGHEINNPLAVISGRAQLLLATERKEDRRFELSRIIAQARRAHEMIADLRLLGRPPRPQLKRWNLATLVERFVNEFNHFLIAESKWNTVVKKLTLDWNPPHSPIFQSLDADATLTILHAVTKNAMEAILRTMTPESHVDVHAAHVNHHTSDADHTANETRETIKMVPWTQIWLSLSQENTSPQTTVTRLEISDWGEAITAEVREHLFDPFYSGRQAGRGLGFGLSKAKRLMELMGGTLSVRSTGAATPMDTIHSSTTRPAVQSTNSSSNSSLNRPQSRTMTTVRLEWTQSRGAYDAL